MSAKLPPLPDGDRARDFLGGCTVYTAEQLTSYAAAAVAAERGLIRSRLLAMDDAVNGMHNYYAHAALVLFGPDDAMAEIERLRAVALLHVPHAYEGDCPDELDRTRRDRTCPACRLLGAA